MICPSLKTLSFLADTKYIPGFVRIVAIIAHLNVSSNWDAQMRCGDPTGSGAVVFNNAGLKKKP